MENGKTQLEKILLVVLPYWDPLIPPRGVAHLKYFLQRHGYSVTARDANTETVFRDLYDRYFNTIKKHVPREKWGNFFNIGHDVLKNHMTAHINYKEKNKYVDLVKQLVYQIFFTTFNDEQVRELKGVMDDFYSQLDIYTTRLLDEIKPGVLGISVFRDTLGPSMYMFEQAKKINPELKTVMGGCIFSDLLFPGTPNLEHFLKVTPSIDHLVIGEGQNLMLKLLRKDFPPSRRVITLKDIGGETLGFSPINAQDTSDFDMSKYPYLSAQTSISCPFNCSFCNVHEFFGKYKRKDPGQAVEEMVTQYKEHGNQLFFMCDSLLNYTASELSRELIKSDVTLYWDGYLRADKEVCDIENTMLWRRGGYYRARLGVESGSPHVLKLMNKKISIEQIKEAVQSLANAGIKTTTYWVIGHPGEEEEHFQETLDLIEELKDYIYEAECNPFQYGYTGQSESDGWQHKRKLLFPAGAEEMLIVQTWVLDAEPRREVIYDRVNRFMEHCRRLGIPNPYSIYDIYKADERWQKICPNAVPGIIEFEEKGNYVDDTHKVKESYRMETTLEDDGDFGF